MGESRFTFKVYSTNISKPKSERKTWMDQLSYILSWISLNYSIHMNTYMLDPWEQRVFHIIVVLSLITASYTCFVFLPGHCKMILEFLTQWQQTNATVEVT